MEPYYYSDKKDSYSFNPKVEYPVHYWKLAPVFRSQLGGPDGFFFADFRLAFKSEFLINEKRTISKHERKEEGVDDVRLKAKIVYESL